MSAPQFSRVPAKPRPLRMIEASADESVAAIARRLGESRQAIQNIAKRGGIIRDGQVGPRRRAIAGQCADCHCRSFTSDFEADPFTAVVRRKSDTCRRHLIPSTEDGDA